MASIAMTDYRRLVVERQGHVGWLILNRPEAGNAMDALMMDELERAWAELDDDPDVRVIVIAANGKNFCTGVDVGQLGKDRATMRRHSRRTRDADLKISSWHCEVWKPVIAAVNGVCAGGGLHFVADADMVIAASNATFLDPHTSVGQVVAYEAITLLRISPAESIMRMAFTGRHERLTAERAYQLGIVGEVVGFDELRSAAMALAEKVALNSPAALRASKQALWHSLEVGLRDAMVAGGKNMTDLWDHPDHLEGPRAFLEERPAHWQPLEPTVTVGSLLDGIPDEAIHTSDRTVTRDELSASADQLGGLLKRNGIRRGEVIAASLPNQPITIAALFGGWRAGAVYAPLNPRATDAEIAALLDTLRPAAIVTTPEQADRFTDAGIPVILGTDLTWKTRVKAAVAPNRAAFRSYDADVALLQFTSGTTGAPKPVPLRHANVLDLMDKVVANLRGAKTSRASDSSEPKRAPMPNLIPLSLSLWAGIYQVLFAFRVGASIVLMDGFQPATFADLVSRFQIKSTVLPPAAMTMLTEDSSIADLAPLKMIRSITAPLSPVQARRFRDRFGVVVLNCYGQTELGGEVVGWSAADARSHGDSKLGSVGRPLAGIDLDIVEGEILVRTAATITGKIDPDFRDRLTDGWFHTGDLGHLDEDGFLWLDGRVSDMINRGGLKIFPGQVEEVLKAAPGVRDAAVVAVPDERLGEVPWAFVVTQDGPADEAALTAWCREKLVAYKVPVRFVGIPELPRNAVGKVLKQNLAAHAPVPPADATTAGD
jgi:long-chain acyl-CoA synthetase